MVGLRPHLPPPYLCRPRPAGHARPAGRRRRLQAADRPGWPRLGACPAGGSAGGSYGDGRGVRPAQLGGFMAAIEGASAGSPFVSATAVSFG
jgi:hypothetical protein